MSIETQPDTNDVIAAAWRKRPNADYVTLLQRHQYHKQGLYWQEYKLFCDCRRRENYRSRESFLCSAPTLAALLQQIEDSDATS